MRAFCVHFDLKLKKAAAARCELVVMTRVSMAGREIFYIYKFSHEIPYTHVQNLIFIKSGVPFFKFAPIYRMEGAFYNFLYKLTQRLTRRRPPSFKLKKIPRVTRLQEGYFSETRFAYSKNEGFRRKISLIEV